MHHKNIKVMVRKQLKTQFLHWKRLDRRTKRDLVGGNVPQQKDAISFGMLTCPRIVPVIAPATLDCTSILIPRQGPLATTTLLVFHCVLFLGG